MKNAGLYAVLVALFGGLFSWVRGKTMSEESDDDKPEGIVREKAKEVRAIRNNNPGNIEYNPANDWVGQTESSDPRFAAFESLEYGARAQLKLLLNYIQRLGRETIREIIMVYSPPHENPTEALIKHYSKRTGVNPDVPYPTDKESVIKLALAIGKMEAGNHKKINRRLYEKAWKLL